jgi:hypothetical protein
MHVPCSVLCRTRAERAPGPLPRCAASADGVPMALAGRYICSLKYALNLIMIVEFGDPPPTYNATLNSEAGIFTSNDVDKDQSWLYLGILLGVFIVFRTAACVILRFKAS